MVLRGQPVGEQGAADRWTALDPYLAGSGAGAPRGIPCGAPFLFPYELEGPSGAHFSCRGSAGPAIWFKREPLATKRDRMESSRC